MPLSRPHASHLRKGRASITGRAYFITSVVKGRRPRLQPAGRAIIIDSLRWLRDHGRIRLLGYVMMGDHFHVMFMLCEGMTLAGVMSSLKRHTARAINRGRQRQGPLWQEGYHDHAIRDRSDFWNHLHYMHHNPVQCGWAETPEAYRWSTAYPACQADIDWEAVAPLGWCPECP